MLVPKTIFFFVVNKVVYLTLEMCRGYLYGLILIQTAILQQTTFRKMFTLLKEMNIFKLESFENIVSQCFQMLSAAAAADVKTSIFGVMVKLKIKSFIIYCM